MRPFLRALIPLLFLMSTLAGTAGAQDKVIKASTFKYILEMDCAQSCVGDKAFVGGDALCCSLPTSVKKSAAAQCGVPESSVSKDKSCFNIKIPDEIAIDRIVPDPDPIIPIPEMLAAAAFTLLVGIGIGIGIGRRRR